MKTVKSKTKYVYCPNGFKYKIFEIFKPTMTEVVIICQETETKQIYCFNPSNNDVYPSTKKVQKIIAERKKLEERSRELKQELVHHWLEFSGGLVDEQF